jgi:hypothetical protein
MGSTIRKIAGVQKQTAEDYRDTKIGRFAPPFREKPDIFGIYCFFSSAIFSTFLPR